jgi:iron(II)-dependent oxidoreductase
VIATDTLAAELVAARDRSLQITGGLDDGELIRQHSTLMSPLVWDLAHIGNYEQLWLVSGAAGPAGRLIRPELDDLYDAFRHPRADRPALPILGPRDARGYLGDIREETLSLLYRSSDSVDPGRRERIYRMVVQHEHMHDETMLATLQLRQGVPVLTEVLDPAVASVSVGSVVPGAETYIAAGTNTIGTDSDSAALDNERPRHQISLPAFWIDTFPVTNGQFAAFIADGGYRSERWWHPDGRRWLADAGVAAPLGWERDGQSWTRVRFGHRERVPDLEPVQHVCWFEADAYARWAGRRLPTEFEWEKAAAWDPQAQRARRFPWGERSAESGDATLAFTGTGPLHPAAIGSRPAGSSAYGVQQLIGDVWEWTSSTFGPWPGFRADPYREYSEVFFGSDYRVLRGGSWATHPSAIRSTFRNWDYPIRRQIFAGFRCARSAV